MAAERSTLTRIVSRVVVLGGAAAGIALVIAAITGDDTPGWWLAVGVPAALVFGAITTIGIWFRLRHGPDERRARLEEMTARRTQAAEPVERSKVAFRATKHKQQVLRSGIEGVAAVTFVADGGRANEFRQLVYLELLVTVDGRAPYEVRTGEFVTGASAGSVSPGRELWVKVDPSDPQRVAVDWERSLRLS